MVSASVWVDRMRQDRAFWPWLMVAFGLALVFVPTFVDLAQTVWATDEQGHGPIVLVLCVWLFWRKWPELFSAPTQSSGGTVAGAIVCGVLSLLLYTVGRSQQIRLFEMLAAIPLLVACILALRGPQQVRNLWFPLFFILFMLPLPGAFVDAVTQPMKMAVSVVAERLMYQLGYPISRTGVILQIGPYQLLVADACAGLNTLFTLEALGLLYLNIVRTASALRNVSLAILIVPISFTANVVRVVVLCLVTYHFGDEAGQGFLHGFSGMVLFMTALVLIIGFDSVLRRISGPTA